MRPSNKSWAHPWTKCAARWVCTSHVFIWKKKYSGLHPSELLRLKQLEKENAKLKKLVADVTSYTTDAGCGH
jgi:putative transposase